MIMALAISNISMLSGDAAERFVEASKVAFKHCNETDLSDERNARREFESENTRRLESMKENGSWTCL